MSKLSSPKFKVGDKVKLIHSHYNGIELGRTGTILENRIIACANDDGLTLDQYISKYRVKSFIYYIDISVDEKTCHLTFDEKQLALLKDFQ